MPDADLPLDLPALPARGGQRRRHRWLLLGAAAVLSALIGGGTTALLAQPSRTTPTAASPAPSTAPISPAEPSAAPTAEPPPAAPSASTSPDEVPGVVRLTGDAASFRTPSGNIGCQLTATAASCDVRERSWDLPPRPAECQADYGQGAVVEGGTARLSCASDTPFDPAAPVLAYGTGWALGEVRCLSARDGVTCEDTGTGHGFAVSRDAYRLF